MSGSEVKRGVNERKTLQVILYGGTRHVLSIKGRSSEMVRGKGAVEWRSGKTIGEDEGSGRRRDQVPESSPPWGHKRACSQQLLASREGLEEQSRRRSTTKH